MWIGLTVILAIRLTVGIVLTGLGSINKKKTVKKRDSFCIATVLILTVFIARICVGTDSME